ncbi:MAG: [citrate (pro-3S)-lyase] ligase [Lactobacillus sp.]|nr:[citrate (pro-3S)-lyase] ligase [Lactobacillus sp.]MDN6052265.1 [citrate (pro-3S)-lyase] ligase [Lactobacillus sp.]
MDDEIIDLYLGRPSGKRMWTDFLTSLGIHNFSDKEIKQIDFTVGLKHDGKLVATGSVAGNVLKYIAVCNKGAVPGARFAQLISELISRQFQRGVYHLFVFTKLRYVSSFEHAGFKTLAQSDYGAFLENGTPDVHDYLSAIPRIPQQAEKKVAGIVMNANPFTLGHRYLVEQAAKANDLVYLFVVNTDASLFTTAERMTLVQAGVADLTNVMVVNGGYYMVSYVTFPAYFLKTPDDEIAYQTELDARIFRDVIAPTLNIKTRYVGSEPLSHTTHIYNQVLVRELPPLVAMQVITRRQVGEQGYITATEVRRCIQENDLATIETLVPTTTLAFIKQHISDLQARIVAGQQISGN